MGVARAARSLLERGLITSRERRRSRGRPLPMADPPSKMALY